MAPRARSSSGSGGSARRGPGARSDGGVLRRRLRQPPRSPGRRAGPSSMPSPRPAPCRSTSPRPDQPIGCRRAAQRHPGPGRLRRRQRHRSTTRSLRSVRIAASSTRIPTGWLEDRAASGRGGRADRRASASPRASGTSSSMPEAAGALTAPPRLIRRSCSSTWTRSSPRSRCEMTRSLRGKPVLVGGSARTRRGRLVQLRGSALRRSTRPCPWRRPCRLCPEAVVLGGDMAATREVSRQLHRIFRDVTPLVEPLASTRHSWTSRGAIGLARAARRHRALDPAADRRGARARTAPWGSDRRS